MTSKTEDLLYMLLCGWETLSCPTWRNLTESFESWAYRHGLLRQLQRLEKQHLIERQVGRHKDRLHRLTEAGRLQALGGRDPEGAWNRHWDGRWRLVLFDVPEAKSSARNKLRQYLQRRGFGYLQNSVWITPDPVNEERALLADGAVDVESLILLEAHPCAGETDTEIVAGAWDFERIKEAYSKHGEVLAKRPRRRLDTESAANTFYRWLNEERQAWTAAISCDPLLPAELLPPGYNGRQAWQNRLAAMSEAGELMRTFKIPE